jgi:hypothetical protein
VIWNDGVSTFTMQVVTTKTGIASVNFVSGGISLPLYDDGTHGDLIAGDGIYTRNNLTLPPQPLSFNGAFVRTSVAAEIKLTNGKGQFQSVDFGLVGVGLDVPSTKLANGIYATPAAVFVVDPAGAANAGFTPDESVADARGSNFLGKATHALYSVFGDLFDIVVAMPGRPIFDATNNVYGVGVPYCNPASNQVQNIGLPISTDTTWGSKGKLQAVIYHNFGEGAILTHEIGRRWMAFTGKAQNLSFCQACSGAHWNADSDIYSVMDSYISDPRLPYGFGRIESNGLVGGKRRGTF